MSYFIYQSKKIFYKETGDGKPVIMLHGDSASSIMFDMLLPLYQKQFKVILIDFLGNGQSDRIDQFPADLWISQAQQVIALIEHLHYKKVNLIGTSGGAWVAINTALKRPDLIEKVIADSFDGRTLHEDFSKNLLAERNFAKNDESAKQFYQWCQGEDWEKIVDSNTKALLACARQKLPLFCQPLDTLKVLILFLGSLKDNMCRKDLQQEYREMKKIVVHGKIHLFSSGGHPAIISNAKLSAKIITEFINKNG